MSAAAFCNWCGQIIDVPEEHVGPTVPCPKCGSACGVSGVPSKAAPQAWRGPALSPADAAEHVREQPLPRPHSTETLRTAVRAAPEPPRAAPGDEDDENSNPYGVSDVVLRCPHCHKVLADGAKECPACNFNLETGSLPERAFEKLERHWRAGLPRQTRLRFFLAYEAVIVLLAVLALILGSQEFTLAGMLTYSTFISAAAAFILGTYSELHLTRNERGRVTIVKAWTFAFLDWEKTTIKVSDYEGVATTANWERGFLDWFILVWLFLSGIIPGVIWLLYFFGRETYQVALTQDHDYPAVILYRGFDADQARDIATTLASLWPFIRGST